MFRTTIGARRRGADCAAAGVRTVARTASRAESPPVTGSWVTSAWRVPMIWSRCHLDKIRRHRDASSAFSEKPDGDAAVRSYLVSRRRHDTHKCPLAVWLRAPFMINHLDRLFLRRKVARRS